MRFWMIALAIWFLLYAVLALTSVEVKYRDLIMGGLAAVVAVLLFFDRRPPAA